MRNLVIILGDQLDASASALVDFDPAQDALWMAEVDEESTHVISAKQRSTVFLSAMRHFAAELRSRGWSLTYIELDAPHNSGTLAGELDKAILQCKPQQLVMTAPGEWRVLQALRALAAKHAVALDLRDDTHFFSTVRDFAKPASFSKDFG